VRQHGHGEHSKTTLDNDRSIYNSALIHFFGGSYCKDINYAKIQNYLEWVNKRPDKKKLSTKTLSNHLIVLSKFLTHAVRTGHMTAKPDMPKLTQADNPRGWFRNVSMGLRHLRSLI
jgi:site-specific recombinase XerD